jgi:hypothetical protein
LDKGWFAGRFPSQPHDSVCDSDHEIVVGIASKDARRIFNALHWIEKAASPGALVVVAREKRVRNRGGAVECRSPSMTVHRSIEFDNGH